jgi:hypothetical protein
MTIQEIPARDFVLEIDGNYGTSGGAGFIPIEGLKEIVPKVTTNDEVIHLPVEPDPFVHALARYVEALHRRYPDGPDELRREGLDARAKVSGMTRIRKDPAA